MDVNTRHHHLVLGFLEMLGVLIMIGFGIWFYVTYVGFVNQNYNPNGDEKKLGIDYDFDAIGVTFIVFSSLSILVYLIGGAIFFINSGVMLEKLNYKANLLSTSILTALFGVASIVNGGFSLNAYYKINQNYSSDEKQNAKDSLRENGIPYLDLGLASLIAGILEILLMIVLISYYFIYIKEEEKEYIPLPDEPVPPVKENYLFNDTRNL